ncbi:MAG: phosphatidate cytidylyltransferase [Pseudomonadales bacterium]
MLKSRIITGLILAVGLIAVCYLLPLTWYALVFWVIGGLGAYEYSALAGMTRMTNRIAYVGGYSTLVALTWWQTALQLPGLWVGVAVWSLALLAVLTYPGSASVLRRGWVSAGAGLLICWAAWIALVVIRDAPSGSHWILWLMVLVAGADVGAFFAGRAFGHTRLAPEVSPGKTWEGLWGGLAMASLMCGLILLLMGRFNAGWLLIMVLLVVMSVFGDLFESVLKRVRGMKDSGSLLPGHGGVLDRIDSAVAVLPCFALILVLGGLSDMG